METKNPRNYVIDAAGQSLGRVATRVARCLQGKTLPEYTPNVDSGISVVVKNISQAVFTGQKFEQKEYHHYSGYPGGLKTVGLKERWERDPADVFRGVVTRMLPDNKLRAKRIRRLTIQK